MGGPDGTPSSAGIDHRWLRAVSAFLIGGVLMGLYLWVVGVDAIQQALTQVSTRRLASLATVGVIPLVVWGVALHLVFVRLGIVTRLTTAVLLFSASGFLNGITPFGQVGGDPITALLFNNSLGTDFETGLAAIGSVNALNRIAALLLGLVGVASLGTRVAFSQTIEFAAAVTVALTLGVFVAAVVAWQYRQRLIQRSATTVAVLLAPAGRLPFVTPPSRESLAQRGHRFTGAISTLVESPGTLGLVFVASTVGQLAVASTLWVALAALGSRPPFVVVALMIPIAKLSGLAPTPGGFGSAEAILTALMVATTGVDLASAGAAALLYRAAAFWLPSIAGAVATAWYATRKPLSPDERSGPPDGLYSTLTQRATEIGTGTVTLAVASLALAGLLWLGVHNRQVLIEPGNPLVHITRDSALAVLSAGMVWLALRRATTKWLD
ncbi:MAG: YbhN family protein [Halobellus sp.]|uniref:YbhN family protein n=1 Tax=Halobellus sp. TaxID=1979212 RepID=UPI0035D44B49